jgi:hypothetical protein
MVFSNTTYMNRSYYLPAQVFYSTVLKSSDTFQSFNSYRNSATSPDTIRKCNLPLL